MGEALVSHNFSPISMKISFHMTKKMNQHAIRNNPKIEGSNGWGFGQPQFLANFNENFISHDKKNDLTESTRHKVMAQNFQSIKNIFDFRTESVSQEWLHVFLKRAGRCQQRLQSTR